MKRFNFGLTCMKLCNLHARLGIMLFCLFAGINLSWGQDKKITGTVVDFGGEPLIGVSVLQKGTSNGTVTDFDGNFQLSVPQGETLLFSYVGYISQEVIVDNKSVLSIRLAEDTQALEEVVVIGYGIQKKSSVTGAISQVKSEDMMNRSVTRPEQALQGKTAGVQIVQTSGSPGASPEVRVRGYSSNVSSKPLYVVDGIRQSSIGGLDPNDIASMEVLKDAASAAIYGAEAGNGVILITTKRGAQGMAKISYDFQFSSQSLARMPKLLKAQEYVNYMSEGSIINQEAFNAGWNGTTDTNWADESFEDSKMQKHNLSIQAGNDKGSFYLSLSYLDNNGIVMGDNDTYQRLTASLNADYKVKDWLKVGTTNQVEKYNRKNVSENNEYGSLLAAVLQLDPLTPFTYNPANITSEMQKAISEGRTLLTDANGDYYAVSKFYTSEQYHPMIMRDQSVASNSGFNVNGSIFADLTPFEGFTFTSRLGYRLSATRNPTYDYPFFGNTMQSRDYAAISNNTSSTIYYQWENFANYIKQIGKHEITGMIGTSFQEQSYDYTEAGLSANGAHAILKNDPSFGFFNFASSTATRTLAGEKTRSAKWAYFGRLGYNYDNKYMIQASLRADAADLSLLPKTNRWGYFPAVSGGWVISNEEFFGKEANPVSFLKLRASWGQNGSLASLESNKYAYTTDIAKSGIYPFFSAVEYVTGAKPSTMGNDKLKWETSEQINIGIDSRFLNDRLTFSVDYYEKQTKDLLVSGTKPSLSLGGTTSAMNAGDVKNNGFEFELDWRDRIGDFSYGIRANLATLKNKVTYLDPSLARIAGTNFHTATVTYFEEGYPVYYFRGYRFDGVDAATGDPTFKDVNEDGVINDDDKTYIGDAISDFTYGITLTAAWKGFDLTVFGTGSQGNDVFNGIARSDYLASNRLREIFYDGRWTSSNTNASIPRAGMNNYDKYLISDAMVFDGSYFKIKQIQLGYTLPKSLLNKTFMGNLRLYASLDDFVSFTSYPGFDPEASAGSSISAMGIDKGAYPTSKKIVVGFNIEF